MKTSINVFLKCFVILFFLFSCSTSFLKYQKKDTFFKNDEFDKTVKIETVENTENVTSLPAATQIVSATQIAKPTDKLASNNLKKVNAKNQKNKTDNQIKKVIQIKREPDIEDSEGFADGSRRPLIDPFKVGEKIIHSVKYFSAEAGRLTLEVKPMAQVNGKKSYQFGVGLKSSRLFSNFYSVDDQVDTFLDYDLLIPYVLKINIKESGKLAQAQSIFDHQKLRAKFWEKKYTDKDGEEEKKYEWDILPFSQNAYSGLFYMRIFKWKLGKEISFRVAEDEKNIVFKGTAVAHETLETEVGSYKTFKVKASIFSRGALSQTGDVFIWISDDEHKYILKIEAKIKIGSLVSEVVEIQRGKSVD